MVYAEHSLQRAQLEEERARVREQLDALHEGEFDENFADTSQVTAERGEIDALTSSLTETLHEIEDALARIEGGTYGRCESCGGDIGLARLEAMPAARLCIDCASRRR